MTNEILKHYIQALETEENKIVGVYIQGSTTLGYADDKSDIDYSVIWEPLFTNAAIRSQHAIKLGFKPSYIGDSSFKGTDRFSFDGKEINVSHKPADTFFSLYDQLTTSEVNEAKLFILGGFKRGQILFDPKKALINFQDRSVVTQEIVHNFRQTREQALHNNKAALLVSAQRSQVVESIKCLNFLLTTLGILTYLENGQFPHSTKWFEKDAEAFGWTTSTFYKACKLVHSGNLQAAAEVLNT